MKKLTPILVLILFLSGCASLYFPAEPSNPELLSDTELLNLIRDSSSDNKGGPKLLEAMRRELITPDEAYCIEKTKFEIGMSERAMKLMMNKYYSLHTYRNKYGATKQYSWGHPPYLFVYIEDGKVTSWSTY